MILAIVIIIAVAILIYILFISKGKPIKLLDKRNQPYKNGISTRDKISINGTQQWLFVLSENKENPVLLYLHGGPGGPDLIINKLEPDKRLESMFTVCYWEQRGAGMSYSPNLDKHNMTMQNLIDDCVEVSKYLANRFNQNKIYIMGHSWGTLLGIKAVAARPDLYNCYFSIAQVTDQLKSEQLAYDFFIKQALKSNDKKVLKKLSKIDVKSKDFPTYKYLWTVKGKLADKYNVGTFYNHSISLFEIIKRVITFKGYGFTDLIKYAKGFLLSTKTLERTMYVNNLFESNTVFDVPIYFFHGQHDQQVSYQLAKQYHFVINCPNKLFITLEQCSHSPHLEQPQKLLEIIHSIMQNENKSQKH